MVYEKRRTRWKIGKAEVALDELPFGLFMEIEGTEKEIARVEKLLEAEALPAVMETYPALTAQLGQKRGGVIEARFARSVRDHASAPDRTASDSQWGPATLAKPL